jgi:hypothetical protein
VVEKRFEAGTQISGSYTYVRAFDNSSYSCCTANSGFENPRIGAEGPNTIGGAGDEDAAWGPSAFVRNHTFILTGIGRLPWDIDITGIWRSQSGNPWGPEIEGDINGDGVRFNDRPFIYAPNELPVGTPGVTDPIRRDSLVLATRARYARTLDENECLSDHIGEIIPRNACRQPWFNRLDLRLQKGITTGDRRLAEISVDLFNVLNGLNKDWGKYEFVLNQGRNIYTPTGYNAVTGQIEYTVPSRFGELTPVGFDLLQFSAQVSARLYF